MGSGPLTMTGVNSNTPAVGRLFSGLKFFINQRVPSRTTYVDKVKSNGGDVVRLEAQADLIIADHLRPNFAPPNSISYTFIDVALRTGHLPDRDDHRAGPAAGTAREVGSSIPGKATRTPFTAQDDRDLWDWVEQMKNNGSVKGNEIYKQLEARNPRHPFQAWRDRYIRKLAHAPPMNLGSVQSPGATLTTPTSSQPARDPSSASQSIETSGHTDLKPENRQEETPPFTVDELEAILEEVPDILKLAEDKIEDSWEQWAQENPSHSAAQWTHYFHHVVLPEHSRRSEAAKQLKRKIGPAQELTVTEASGQQKRRKLDDHDQLDVTGTSARNTEPLKQPPTFSEDGRDGMNEQNLETAVAVTSDPSFDGHEFQIGGKDGEDEEGNNTAQTQIESIVPDEGIHRSPVALTKENLANQQAQHKAQLLRGVDLPVTDETQDQSVYIAYLQDVIGQGSTATPVGQASVVAGRPLVSEHSEAELPSEPALQDVLDEQLQEPPVPNGGSLSPVQFQGFLSSSQAEIEDNSGDSYIQRRSPYMTKPKEQTESADDSIIAPVESVSPPIKTQAAHQSTFEEEIEITNFQNEAYHSRDLQDSDAGTERKREDDIVRSSASSEAAEGVSGDEDEADGEIFMTIPAPDGGFPSLSQADEVLSADDNEVDDGVYPAMPEPEGGLPTLSQAELRSEGRQEQQHGYVVDLTQDDCLSEEDEEDEEDVRPTSRLPNAKTIDTQAILNSETLQLDFDIPPPPEMHGDNYNDAVSNGPQLPSASSQSPLLSFSSRKSEEVLSESDGALSSTPLAAEPAAVNNISAHSDLPDPNLQMPRSSNAAFSDLDHPSQNSLPSVITFDSQSESEESFLEFIDSLVQRGFAQASVEKALYCSSMRGELAELILLEGKRGKGFPTDVAGVWSAEDDEAVQGSDPRLLEGLKLKHGEDECQHRLNFLDDWTKED